MMKMSNELAEQFDFAKSMQTLKEIQEETEYQAQPLNPVALSNAALSQLSVYTNTAENVNRITNAIARVGEQADEFHQSITNEEVASGFHFAVLGLNALNFFRIPLLYLAAYMLNQQVPFTMSNNLRWAYSSVLLALTITAVAAPVTAPIIAFVVAGIGFASSSFFLGKIFYERFNLARKERSLQREIDVAEKEMLAIRDEAQLLEQYLNEATEEGHIKDVSLEIIVLKERYDSQQQFLDRLYDKRLHNQQLRKTLGFENVVMKGLSLFLASATVIGLVVSLFVPPVGLGILAGVAVAGAAYLVGLVLAPLVPALGRWMSNKKPSPSESEESGDDHAKTKSLTTDFSDRVETGSTSEQNAALDAADNSEEVSLNTHDAQDSTSVLLCRLQNKKHSAASVPKKIDEESVETQKLSDSQLSVAESQSRTLEFISEGDESDDTSDSEHLGSP